MSIVLDIARTYTRPREVQSRQMRAGENSEGRALAILMGACFLLFVATLPNLSRQAFLDPSIPFQGRMAAAFFGWVLLMPLVFYVVSLVLIVVLKLFRVTMRAQDVRMAIFWGLLASVPLWLLAGLSAGFTGESSGTFLSGVAAIGAFVIFTIFGLVAARRTAQETAL